MVKNLFVFPLGKEIESGLRHMFFDQYNSIYFWGNDFKLKQSVNRSFVAVSLWDEVKVHCTEALIVYEEKTSLDLYKLVIDQLKSIQLKIKIVYSIANKLGVEESENITVIGRNTASIAVTVKQLVPVNVPVVSILGDGELCGKFDVQVSISQTLRQMGINVLCFSSKEYSECLGMKLIPQYIFEPNLLSDKIVALNQYFYREITIYNPDLVLIDIPGGALPISAQFVEDFGEFAYVLSNALLPDILIRTLYYNNYNLSFFESDMQTMKYKYNITPEIYCISGTSLVYPPSLMDELGFLSVEPKVKEMALARLRNENLPFLLCELENQLEVDHTCKKIIDTLSGIFTVI